MALSRKQARHLITKPDVRVALHDDYGRPLRWVEPKQKAAVWRDIEASFDSRLEVRKSGVRGRIFDASLWRRGEAELLVFAWD